MIWVIASLPFWIVGILLSVAALAGGYRCLQTDKTGRDIMNTVIGFTSIMMFAGGLLYLAAKICS